MPKDKPEIRFAGYTDAWEKRKLGKVANFFNGRAYKQAELLDKGKYPVLRVGNFGTNTQWYYSNMELADKFYANKNDLLYTWATAFGPHIWRGDKVIYHYHIWKIQLSDELEENFTYWMLEADKANLTANTNGSTMIHVTKSEMESKEISIPFKEEQLKIGKLMNKLDQLITVNQRKVDLLKELKKGFLQKMFPKNGEDKPEIRFGGYTDAWEKRKLGEIGETHSGIGFPENEQGGKKGIPFFKVSDMNNFGNEHEMNVANNYVNDDQLERKKWKVINNVPGIIFAKVGAAIMLNRKRLIKVPFLMDNNTMEYAFDRSWNVYFGKTLFETLNLPKYAQVGALPSYNGSDIETISVEIPEKDEQERIGTFFQRLDQLITVNQRRVDLLKQEKKALLQKMFV